MKLLVVFCVTIGAFAMTAAAEAQVTQTYSYDGNGRLIGVTTSGSGGTNTASYAYDKVHNRVQRVRSGTTTYAALHDLPDGGLLAPLEALVSPDGRFTFALRATGRLELWRDDDRLWSVVDLHKVPSFEMTDVGTRLVLGEQVAEAQNWSVTDEGSLLVTAAADGATVWSSAASVQ